MLDSLLQENNYEMKWWLSPGHISSEVIG